MNDDVEQGFRVPTTDWVSDWDWLDDRWGSGAIEIWNSIRERCPVATSDRYGRQLMPVTMDAVAQVALDTGQFSSMVNLLRPTEPRDPAPPITSDPPDHRAHRRLLLPAFNPKQIEQMEGEMRRFCRALIALLDTADAADAAEQYGQHIPVHGICEIVGIPESDGDLFRNWIYRKFQQAHDDSVREQVTHEMNTYIDAFLQDRLEHPRDDVGTLIAHAEIDGAPADWVLKSGYLRLMIIAGIDTTWSAIAAGLWHFGQHPEQVARLIAADDADLLWQTAVEEVLRYYAPVVVSRKAVQNTTLAGCPVHQGDQVLLTFPAANHDPAAFDQPDVFDIGRAQNRHVAFGLGIHRCLGAPLARLELTVALQEWLRAFPTYTLDPDATTTWANGPVRGPRNVPVRLNR